jgi:hypothetical protein
MAVVDPTPPCVSGCNTDGIRAGCTPQASLPFGRGRIRTHETREGLTVFKTAAFDHSATLPNFFSTAGGRIITRKAAKLPIFTKTTQTIKKDLSV